MRDIRVDDEEEKKVVDKKKLPEETKKTGDKTGLAVMKSPTDQKDSATKLTTTDSAGHKKQKSGNATPAKVAVQKQPVHVVKDPIKTNGVRPPSKGLPESRCICLLILIIVPKLGLHRK